MTYCENCGSEMDAECKVCCEKPVQPNAYAEMMKQARLQPEDIACIQLIEETTKPSSSARFPKEGRVR